MKLLDFLGAIVLALVIFAGSYKLLSVLVSGLNSETRKQEPTKDE